MPRTAPHVVGASPIHTHPPLATLAHVATTLASGVSLDEMVLEVLRTLRDLLGAPECAVWLVQPSGLVRGWGVGEARTTASQVTGWLEGDAGDTGDAGAPIVAALSAGMRQLGAVTARVERPISPEERAVVSIAATLLAPQLAHEEYSHQLEVEVELRTRQIEEQRRFIERIIDSLPVGLYVIDREYRIQAWNRKRETGMQGVSREEAIGRTIFEILHRQPAELLRREFDDVFRTGRIQQFQMESSASGEVRVYRITKIPMRLDDSQVTHVITVGEDVTEWKEAEARFAQAEKLAAIGTLAAGVMHEINNPLATIAACAESMLLDIGEFREGGRDVPTEWDDYLKIVDDEVRRCKHIVDGLLDFSRPRPATKEPLDVNAVLDRTLFLLKHHSRFKKLLVHTELDRALGSSVRGNPEQLVQVFMALLLNAMDAMEERGTITLRTYRRHGASPEIVAEVVDEGAGISRSEISKIFEPFYTTKPPGRGTGLGLSICYGIVAEHGGRLEVDSTMGKGSVFRVVLPAGSGA